MTKISATIIGDSVSPSGDRITTMLMTFPRSILAELNTHRMFSRNSSSSRAIPFNKMVQTVIDEPFIPMAWQIDHKGMQGAKYFTDPEIIEFLKVNWLAARNYAVEMATELNNAFVTKQVCNRLLEPFMWHTALVTSTEWENFFEQRCPEYWLGNPMDSTKYKSRKDAIKALTEQGFAPTPAFSEWDEVQWLKFNKGQAEIHMMALAEAVWDAMNESKPVELKAGEWHIPFGDKITEEDFEYYLSNKGQSKDELISNLVGSGAFTESELTDDYLSYNYKWSDKYNVWLTRDMINFNEEEYDQFRISISTSMCARTSYTTIGEEKEINYQNLIDIHDRMISAKPIHYSPFEHCAKVMDSQEYYSLFKGRCSDPNLYNGNGWCNNFKGFIPYRYMIEHPNEF